MPKKPLPMVVLINILTSSVSDTKTNSVSDTKTNSVSDTKTKSVPVTNSNSGRGITSRHNKKKKLERAFENILREVYNVNANANDSQLKLSNRNEGDHMTHLIKSRLAIGLILLTALIFAACGTNKPEASTGVPTAETPEVSETAEKPKLVATLFPQYDFVREIAGDLVEVSLLLPPGVESHSYEPTPKDIAGITEADAFLYTGEVMEPWATKIIGNLGETEVKIVDLSQGITLLAATEEEGAHEDEEEGEAAHEEGAYDPHIWLDPNNAKIMVSTLLETLIEIEPENEAVFRENAEAYLAELTALDLAFKDLFAKSETQTIYYGGHFVFGYFAKAYGLTTVSPYDGFSPDAEPTPKRIADLIDAMDQAKFKVIYYEELVDPKIARLVSQETGAEMVLLHGAHNLSKEELASGASYLELMKQNLEKLKLGMGYRE
jgi:zinc transport system substrate-binding protein